MRKLVLMMVCISLLLTGCWDYQEVDRLATVLAVGIDRIPGSSPILLTLQVVTPQAGGSKQSGGGGEKTFTIMNSEGTTLSEAINSMSKQSPRRILISHCKVIILGKDLVETGIGDILDELKRSREFRRTIWTITADRTAKEILENNVQLAKIPAQGLDQILLEHKKAGLLFPSNGNDFYVRLNEDSRVGFTPFIQLEDIDQQVNSQLEKETGRSLDSEEKPRILTIAKTAIFKNLKMVGVLNEDESRALRVLNDTPKGSTITITYASQDQTDGDKKKITLGIQEGNVTITPQISDDGIMMKIVCKTKASVLETQTDKLNLLDLKEEEQLEGQAAEAVRLELAQTIDKAQKELNTDFVGFAEKLHGLYPVEWKRVKDNWDEIFPTVRYQISCEVKILNTGMRNNPTLQGEPGGAN